MNVNGQSLTKQSDVAALATKDLVAVYNALTGKNTTKFASREKGVSQTWGALKVALASQPKDETPKVQEAPAPKAEKPAKVAKEPKLPKAKKVKVAKEPKAKRERGVFNYAPAGQVEKHRENTKRATVIDLLQRPKGATFDDIKAATGWDDKTAYDGVRLLHTYLGYGLRTEDGRIYLVSPK